MNIPTTHTIIAGWCCILLALYGCKDSGDGVIPSVPIDQTINLNLPAYNDLQTVGGWTYVSGGSRGILIYRVGLEDFTALDRHCTYNVPEECQVVVPGAGSLMAADTTCCGSEFSIIDGTPLTGKADKPLRAYQTFYDGNNLLRITN